MSVFRHILNSSIFFEKHQTSCRFLTENIEEPYPVSHFGSENKEKNTKSGSELFQKPGLDQTKPRIQADPTLWWRLSNIDNLDLGILILSINFVSFGYKTLIGPFFPVIWHNKRGTVDSFPIFSSEALLRTCLSINSLTTSRRHLENFSFVYI